jgi:hypothetical protein
VAPEDVPTSLSAPGRSRETARRVMILIALYAIPATIVMQPVQDFDIWWHLRTGQWIVEHGMVPATDPFSSFGHGKPWVAYSWLFEVLVHGLYNWLGLYGIILYRAVLAFAVAAAVHRLIVKRAPGFLVATGLTGLVLISFASLMKERPWLFTLLFFTWTLDAILDLRTGRANRWIWLLPLLYALWANLHIQFIYGLFLLGLACAAPGIDRLLGRSRPGEYADTAGSRAWWRLVALSGACLAATLLNPYHARLYAVIGEYATQPFAFQVVSEHRAMDFRGPLDWIVLAWAGWAAFALGRRRLSTFELLLLAASAYFSFHTQRDLWFVVLAALAILLTQSSRSHLAIDHFVLTRLRLHLVCGGVILVLGVTGWGRGLSPSGLERAIAERFPVKAAAFVEEHHLAGPLYNQFDWGGYLIWRLPALPVAIDGRTNLHGDDRLLRSCRTWAGERGWDSDPELNAAGLVIANANSPLASLLRLDVHFKLVHEDPLAVVFIPQARANQGPAA